MKRPIYPCYVGQLQFACTNLYMYTTHNMKIVSYLVLFSYPLFKYPIVYVKPYF